MLQIRSFLPYIDVDLTFYTVDHIIWLVDLTIKCKDLICRSIDLNYRLQLVSRSYYEQGRSYYYIL